MILFKPNISKNLVMIFLGTIAFFECYGQKYEVWIKTTGNLYDVKRNLDSFNDSVLTVKSNPTLLNLYNPKNLNFKWNEIDALKIRNKSRHNIGILIGSGAGFLAVLLFNKSYPEGHGDFIGPVLFDIPIFGAGVLAGHLFTSAKIVVPLNGKTAKEKSQTLKNRINKKP